MALIDTVRSYRTTAGREDQRSPYLQALDDVLDDLTILGATFPDYAAATNVFQSLIVQRIQEHNRTESVAQLAVPSEADRDAAAKLLLDLAGYRSYDVGTEDQLVAEAYSNAQSPKELVEVLDAAKVIGAKFPKASL
jgi:hypothetical protein